MSALRLIAREWVRLARQGWVVTKNIRKIGKALRVVEKHGIGDGTNPVQSHGAATWINVKAERIQQIVPLLRDLAARGHRAYGKPVDLPTSLTRGYHLRGGVTVWVRLEPAANGPTCHYVQTGTRVEPVYELRCDEVPA